MARFLRLVHRVWSGFWFLVFWFFGYANSQVRYQLGGFGRAVTDRESAGSVGMVHLSVNLSESLKLSGRYEKLDKDPGGNNLPEAEATAAVINYKVQSGLTARVEWNDLRVKRTTSASVDDESRWDMGALVSF